MKILKLFLVTTIFLNSFVSLAFATDDTQTTTKPVLKIGGNNVYNVNPGKTTNITIPVVNTSADMALDVLIQTKTANDAPFTVSFLNSSDRTTKILRGGSHTVSLAIDVDNDAKTGKYPITLDFSFTGLDKQTFTSSSTFNVKIDNGTDVPTVSLNNLKTSKTTVKQDETFDVTGVLQCLGTKATNINVELIGLEENNLSVVGTSNLFFKEIDANKSMDINFKLKPTTITKEGSNKITIKVTYTDYAQKQYTKDYFVYVTVSKNGSSTTNISDLKITNLVAPTGVFGVGSSGTFKIKIKNMSNNTAKNIKVSTKLPENIVPTSNNILIIPELLANQEKELTFTVAPTSSATTQTYSIGFLVQYDNGSKEEQANTLTLEQYAGFSVKNDTPQKEGENAKVSVPKIIVSKYQSTPTIVEAGKNFTLDMTFKNTHQTKTVKNIKIYLTIDDKTEQQGSVFVPDNSSTTYFIDQIAPKQEVSHTFNLFAVPDAKPRSYTINVNFEYEDEVANEFKATELVGVNVKQQANLELSDIAKQDTGSVGVPMNLSFQLYNTGKVTLSNLMVKLDGQAFDTSTATSFIGNFDQGSTEYYDATFTPLQPGEQTLTLKITYDDTDGKQIEKTEDFKIMIEEEMTLTEDIDNMSSVEDQNQSELPIKIIGIICVVVCLIGILIFVFVKKLKAKKEFDFND